MSTFFYYFGSISRRAFISVLFHFPFNIMNGKKSIRDRGPGIGDRQVVVDEF